jgi:hypothetical protein
MENPFKKENIKKIVKIGLMSTALAFGTANNNEISAQTNKVEQSSNTQTSWAKEALKLADSELRLIANGEDARMYAIKMAKLFTSKIGILADENNKNINYSLEEYQYLLKQAQKLYNILETLDQNYGNNRANSLDNVLKILQTRSTYAGYQQYQQLRKF